MRDFRQLKVWQESHQITLEVYRITKSFPKEELFALTNQIRRASVSIPSDIAEGCGARKQQGLCKFLQMALGSAFEVDYQLLLAEDLTYLNASDYLLIGEKVNVLKKQLASLLQKVREAS